MSPLPCSLSSQLTHSEHAGDSQKLIAESCDLGDFLGTADKGAALH